MPAQSLVIGAAAKPRHHARIAPGQRLGGQALAADFAEFVAQAEMVQLDAQETLGLGGMQVITLGHIQQYQHIARHQFDNGHAHGHQGAISHPGEEAVGADLFGRLARQGAGTRLERIDVIDGDGRQAITVADGAQLAGEPGAVIVGHGAIAAAAGIVAAIERFGSHRVSERCHLREQFEAAIEDELGLRIAALEFAQRGDHGLGLGGALGIGLGKELVGIKGIEEETAPSLRPQGCHDLVEEEVAPAGCGLVDHAAAPGDVVAPEQAGRHLLVVRP
jgi:hypothetical protein